jgi:hypothetical protein
MDLGHGVSTHINALSNARDFKASDFDAGVLIGGPWCAFAANTPA